MIQLAAARRSTPRQMLDASGGFAWWYVDAVDADGNGLVLIWSWGLPFLPGYTDAARAERAPAARARPSLNLALYRRGRPFYYLLQEYPEDEAELGENHWRVGRSLFSHTFTDDDVALHAEICCTDPTTGHEVSGSVVLSGPLGRQVGADTGSTHIWGPITSNATVDVALQIGEQKFGMQGHGYHDRNFSPTHIDSLGIKRWTWVRASGADGAWIVYALQGNEGIEDRTIVLQVAPDGTTTEYTGATVAHASETTDLFGVSYARRLLIEHESRELLAVTITDLVDRGPFYLRGNATIAHKGSALSGFAEVVVPRRVDMRIHRPLVRMAVHHTTKRNSIWLPLFAGPIEGRVGRLLQTLGGGR